MSDATKVCVSCETDVSTAPRKKDSKGRYFCAPCVTKLQSSRKRTTARKAEPTDVMSMLLNDSKVVNAPKCLQCGTALLNGAVVCMQCGQNTETGRTTTTKVVERRQVGRK
jgi:ribosomal protein L32